MMNNPIENNPNNVTNSSHGNQVELAVFTESGQNGGGTSGNG